ncbi:MAG: Trk family potassium uptake protein [Clostridia bacterium]|nr:Trk family potassium uptake protein [Clostridia bacterium]
MFLKRIRNKFSSFQIILLGFAAVIVVGALLLMLPISSRSEKVTPFFDALFTSTSAVCVTGLIVQDTATYWSGFGQLVILILIQIGGMGVITVAAAVAIFSGKKIGLMQRDTMQDSLSAPSVGGIVHLVRFILKAILRIELIGAAIMMPVFIRDFGAKGIWMSFFHSISAFCNAGFDLMGYREPFSSLTSYTGQPVINVVIMLLIVIGGIGFLTWEDVCKNKLHFRKYRMQSKVIILITLSLIVLPAVFFYFVEFTDLPAGKRLLASLFQSITPRTAGFNTVDLNSMNDAGLLLMIPLMLIGGAPGSTAGGLKITTLAVLIASVISIFRKRDNAQLLNRRVSDETVKHAAAIFMIYISLFFAGGLTICAVEGLPLRDCLFETASAVGTVGLSLGLTPTLGTVSKAILILLMFFGRVGCLTLIYATLGKNIKNGSKLPLDKITVG